MVTSSLNEALEKLESDFDPGKRVFARERGKTREFDILSPSSAWNETQSKNSSHLYEVLSGPCNMYLDVEWKRDEPPAGEHARVLEIIAEVTQKLKDSYGVTNPHIFTVTASGWVGDKYKCSWHVHFACKNVCWASAGAAGDFVRTQLAHITEIDKIPYNAPKQNWRCVGNSKASDPDRKFVPSDKDTFMNCLVGVSAGNRKIIEKSVCRKRSLSAQVPEWICELVGGLGEMRTESILMIGDRFVCVPFRNRVPCRIAGRTHSSNHQYAVIDLYSMKWRQKCHNGACQLQTDRWRLMPNFEVAHRCWNTHVRKEGNAQRPAMRVGRAPEGYTVTYRVNQRGPPVFVSDKECVHCSNGLFVKRRESC